MDVQSNNGNYLDLLSDVSYCNNNQQEGVISHGKSVPVAESLSCGADLQSDLVDSNSISHTHNGFIQPHAFSSMVYPVMTYDLGSTDSGSGCSTALTGNGTSASSEASVTTPSHSLVLPPLHLSPQYGTAFPTQSVPSAEPMFVPSDAMPHQQYRSITTLPAPTSNQTTKKKSSTNGTGPSPSKKSKKLLSPSRDSISINKDKEKRILQRYNGLSEDEVKKKQLPDYLRPGLDMVIIGINPSLASADIGHHYGGTGNHFWECLYESGLVPVPVTCYDDHKMVDYGIGFTNFCTRPTKGTAELTRKELKMGIEVLMQKIHFYQPKIAVFNGKGIYAAYMGHKNFHIGKQPDPLKDTNTLIFVMPSSSARCAQLPQAADKLPFFVALRKMRDFVCGRPGGSDVSEEEMVFRDYTEMRISQPDPKSLIKAERRRQRLLALEAQQRGLKEEVKEEQKTVAPVAEKRQNNGLSKTGKSTKSGRGSLSGRPSAAPTSSSSTPVLLSPSSTCSTAGGVFLVQPPALATGSVGGTSSLLVTQPVIGGMLGSGQSLFRPQQSVHDINSGVPFAVSFTTPQNSGTTILYDQQIASSSSFEMPPSNVVAKPSFSTLVSAPSSSMATSSTSVALPSSSIMSRAITPRRQTSQASGPTALAPSSHVRVVPPSSATQSSPYLTLASAATSASGFSYEQLLPPPTSDMCSRPPFSLLQQQSHAHVRADPTSGMTAYLVASHVQGHPPLTVPLLYAQEDHRDMIREMRLSNSPMNMMDTNTVYCGSIYYPSSSLPTYSTPIHNNQSDLYTTTLMGGYHTSQMEASSTSCSSPTSGALTMDSVLTYTSL